MQIHGRFSEDEIAVLVESKVARGRRDGGNAYLVPNGRELGELAAARCAAPGGHAEVAAAAAAVKGAAGRTERTLRISAETGKLLAGLAEECGITRADVVRGLIELRRRELDGEPGRRLPPTVSAHDCGWLSNGDGSGEAGSGRAAIDKAHAAELGFDPETWTEADSRSYEAMVDAMRDFIGRAPDFRELEMRATAASAMPMTVLFRFLHGDAGQEAPRQRRMPD